MHMLLRDEVAALRRRLYLTAGARVLRNDGSSDKALRRLHTGWANQGFSADLTFLREVLTQAAVVGGPILECGSGLTTVALATAGHDVWSLEHHQKWRLKVLKGLRVVHAEAKVVDAPLRPYGGLEWYSLPEGLPGYFPLVVCDGPPSGTPGGRSGLWHVMEGRIGMVLLDDAARPGEQALVQELAGSGWQVQRSGTARRHVALTR